MISISSLVTIAIWVVPWLLPRALGFYRSIKASNRRPGAIHPPPPRVQNCLNILFICVVTSLVRTLPYFAPANIYKDTASRLQIPASVLFNRLASVRRDQLTPLDTALRTRYTNAPSDWPLLYAAYGPEVLANCPFCKLDEPSTFMFYALPRLLIPHLVHIFFLGITTSSLVCGAEGKRWRTYATVAGVALACGELIWFWNYDWRLNATKKTLSEVDFFHWRLRLMRLLAFAIVDGVLGWVLWLASTGRFLVQPPSVTMQLEHTTTYLAGIHNKIQALGNIQNTVLRDPTLRAATNDYWTTEVEFREAIERDPEVETARRLAISRMDYDKVQQATSNWVDSIWNALRPRPPAPIATHEHVD